MLSTTLIAIGLATTLFVDGLVVAVGCSTLGAGLFTPFGRTWLGALAGAVVIALLAALASLEEHFWLYVGGP